MPIQSSSHAYKPFIHQHITVTDSTNSMLLKAVTSGSIANNRAYMLTASMQTSGRGQHTRTWQSPIGNLYLSLYHPISVPLSGLLSLVVGYSLLQLPILQRLNRKRQALNLPTVGVKWANDIGYISSKSTTASRITANRTSPSSTTSVGFKKLAGILIEPVVEDNKIIGVVIGVGMNIESAPHLSTQHKEGMDNSAVSLVQLIEDTYQLEAFDTAESSLTLTTQFIKDAETDLTTNQQSEQSKSLNPSTLPRVEDLYQSVGNCLIKSIERFQHFAESTYDLSRFLEQYDDINILKGRLIEAKSIALANEEDTESYSDTAKSTGISDTQPHEETVCSDGSGSNKMLGKVVGIGEDGSLKLQLNCHSNQHVTHLYNGTIKIIE